MPSSEAVSFRKAVFDRIVREKAVAVVRTNHPEHLVSLARALLKGGVTCFEITMTVPGALEGIHRVTQELGDAVLVGAGSITDAETADRAIEAGARYIVSPVFKPEVIRAAHTRGAAAMPGCFTPTEVLAAYEAGADVVKVFPADILGMAFFKGILAPMPYLRLMPTGGVSLTNAVDWVRAGAVAVGVGRALVDEQALATGDFARLTENARTLCRSLHAVRSDT